MTAIPRPPFRFLVVLLALLCAGLVLRLSVAPPRGLTAEYFAGDPASTRPTMTVVDPEPGTRAAQLRWAGAAPERFTVRWYGYLTVPRSGTYTFTLTSDDGSTLAVDGQMLIDHRGAHGPVPKQGAVALDAGAHAVLVELTQEGGPYALALEMSRNGAAPRAVPSWTFSPERAQAWRVLLGRGAELVAFGALVVWGVAVLWRLLATGWTPARQPRFATFVLFALLAIAHTWPCTSAPATRSPPAPR